MAYSLAGARLWLTRDSVDDLLPGQAVYLVFRQAQQLLIDVGVMLTQDRRRGEMGLRSAFKPPGEARQVSEFAIICLKFGEISALSQLGFIKYPADIEGRPGRHPSVLKQPHRLIVLMQGRPPGDGGIKLVLSPPPARRAGQLGVIRQVRPLDKPAKRLPLIVAGDCDGDPTVRAQTVVDAVGSVPVVSVLATRR